LTLINKSEVVIDSIRVSLTNQQRIVVLREVNGERYLTIWIGGYEAESIAIALQDIEVSRPQTHDLIKKVITSLQAELVRVEVSALKEDVFYASLVLDAYGQTLEVDCRPSDALAMAVRAHVPILVSNDILDAVGILPEKEIEQEPESPIKQPGLPMEERDDRLDVFDDFLKKLDMGSGKDDVPPPDPEPKSPES